MRIHKHDSLCSCFIWNDKEFTPLCSVTPWTASMKLSVFSIRLCINLLVEFGYGWNGFLPYDDCSFFQIFLFFGSVTHCKFCSRLSKYSGKLMILGNIKTAIFTDT